jgi:RHS repeat-associated protein
MTSSYALTNFEVQYWTGSAWATVPGGSVTGNDKVWRKFTFTPLATSKIRVNVTNVAGDNHSQVVELEAYGPLNVAAASNGATATASSTFSGAPATNANNGDHVGTASWWTDNTSSTYPDWLQVDFAGTKTISEIDVYGLQQNYGSPIEPTLTLTSTYALTNFEVQYWTGSAWATVPGGSVTGNDKVWRKFTFTPLATSKIRVNVTNVAGDNHSQIVELEAYTGSSSALIKWLVVDHLGTPRMIVDQSGALSTLKRHDYLPFGEELFAGAGGRTASQGYAPDGVRQQFTQKERDFETGLDSFGARYYASMQGRFTSVDPGNAGADLDKPQSWNGYAYALNNPLRFIDPDGLRWAQSVVNGAIHYQWFDDKEKDDNGQTEYDRAIAAGWTAVKFNESKNYTFVDGLLAPWETVRIVTLTTDGRIVSQTYTISYTEWTALLYWNSKIGGVFSEKLATDFFLSRFADKVAPDNPPSVPAAATTGIKLTPSETKKLGGLSNRAGEKVSEVIRSRGGNASNVREAGPWAEKTLAETAKAAVGGDKTAETAIKIAKQAGRLGQK